MSKRKRKVENPVAPPQPQAQEESIPEPTEAESIPEVVEAEPEPEPLIAPPVQTLAAQYLGMRAVKVEDGVYYALPAWVQIDGYKEGDRVRITVEFERVEVEEPEPESSSAEPAADAETAG
ncbi:MAG: hypothetical protein CFK49_09685 [Armatimonadetes bacterium JP3_11]|jgi:hypothetical protein|nr:MAG: hypothetical protein CFK49_09685 [Armatimonadetes bacterium JP3_11]